MKIKQSIIKSKKLPKILASAGIAIVGLVKFDNLNDCYKDTVNGIDLIAKGAHLKKGVSRVIITDQFYEIMSYENKIGAQRFIMGGIIAAYDRLNEVNTGVQFELCTTVPKVAEDYSIKQIDEIDTKYDILLLMPKELYIDDDKNILGQANHGIDKSSRELINQTITFRRNRLQLHLKRYKEDPEKDSDPKNSYAYSITLHETLHAMGFAHTEDKNSIIYPYCGYENRDLSQDDIEMIEKYNFVFYGKSKKTQNEKENEKAEEYLTF